MADQEPKNGENNDKTGFVHRLRANTPEIVKNNAPRVVAVLKAIASTSMLFSGNKVFAIGGAGFIAAFSTIAFFGGKKTEEQKRRLKEEEEQQTGAKPKGYLGDYINKVTHPSKYPLEAGTGIAMISSMFWTASGVVGKGGFSPGRLAGGALSLASDANIVFTKEQIDQPLTNPHPEGSLSYYTTELRHRPVLLSSMFNIGSDVASIVGGGHEYRKGKEANTLLAGSLLLAANTFQALFVDKNDYNIESKNGQDATPLPEAAPPQPERTAKSWSERAVEEEPAPVLNAGSR